MGADRKLVRSIAMLVRERTNKAMWTRGKTVLSNVG
jgi:hypothetical protein